MLGINCLVDNPSILPQLKETVEYVGYKILEGGNKADIGKVYQTMRKLGIEVDIQTVSHIYQEVFDLNEKDLFSSIDEVESAREDTLRRIIEKKTVTGKQEIGRDNPSVTVASSMASALQDIGKRNPSAQKELEQGLRKAAKRIMDQNKDKFPPAQREIETVEEILNRVFRSEQGQEMTVNEVQGKMGTAKELFEQFQNDIQAIADKVSENDALSYSYGPYGIKLQELANIVQQAGYDMFISQPEIRRVIDDALNEKGFTKEVKDKEGNPKTVTDWNKVIASNVDFKEALREALSAKGFTEAQINSITPTLVREFQALRGEKIKTKLQAEMNKRNSEAGVKRTINETLRDIGFYKENSTDWNKIIGTDLKYITEELTSKLKAKGYSDSEINSILKVFNTLRDEKIKKKLNPKESEAQSVEPKSGIDKLVELNNMGIFEGENKKQLYKMLGVTDLDEKSASVIENLSNILKTVDSRSDLSPTFIKSVNRQIELELNKIQDKGLLLKVANAFASYSQFANGLLISNLGNTIENASSGLLQLAFTMATNPKTGVRYLRDALTVFKDILQGGVREGVNYSDSFSANLNVSDKYNFETANSIKSHTWAIANTLTRTVLETFDSSAKAAMTNIMFASTIKNILTKQGLTPDEANTIINETLYGNNEEINDVAEQLTKALEAGGLSLVSPNVKKERIANELKRANIVSNGTFFQSVIEDLIAKKVVSEKARDIKIDEKVFKGVLNAAEATAGKGLGHSSDNWLFQKIYDQPSRYLSRQLSKARKSGNKSAIAGMTFANTGHYALNRFVGGAARWSWLTFQKTSGLALLQTIITDIVFSGGEVFTPGEKKVFHKELIGKYLKFSKLSDNFDIEYKDGKPVREDGKSQAEYEIEKYLSLRERLKREVIGPLVGYTIASAYLPVLAKLLGFGFDDDDTEEERAAKSEDMAYWLNRPEQADIVSNIKKLAPIQLSMYMGTLSKKDKYGQPIRINPEDDNNDILKTAYNFDVLNSIFIESFNRGGNYNIQRDIETENEKKDGDVPKVLVKYGTELSNVGAAFKFYDMNKNFLNGLKLGQRENIPKAETLGDQFMRSALTRDMYRNYMEGKE